MERHGIGYKKRQRRNSRILFQRISYALFLSGTFLLSGLLIILLITPKRSMLIAAVPDSDSVPFIKSTFDLPVPY